MPISLRGLPGCWFGIVDCIGLDSIGTRAGCDQPGERLSKGLRTTQLRPERVSLNQCPLSRSDRILEMGEQDHRLLFDLAADDRVAPNDRMGVAERDEHVVPARVRRLCDVGR